MASCSGPLGSGGIGGFAGWLNGKRADPSTANGKKVRKPMSDADRQAQLVAAQQHRQLSARLGVSRTDLLAQPQLTQDTAADLMYVATSLGTLRALDSKS